MEKLILTPNSEYDVTRLKSKFVHVLAYRVFDPITIPSLFSETSRVIDNFYQNRDFLSMASSTVFILPPKGGPEVYEFAANFSFDTHLTNGAVVAWCDDPVYRTVQFCAGRNANDRDRVSMFSEIMKTQFEKSLISSIVSMNYPTFRFLSLLTRRYTGAQLSQIMARHGIQHSSVAVK